MSDLLELIIGGLKETGQTVQFASQRLGNRRLVLVYKVMIDDCPRVL